jgi:hypothetical protein
VEKFNYQGAISFLRALIHSPAIRGKEGDDPGWCPSEHALAAQLALCAVGLRPLQATGAIMYLDRDAPEQNFQVLDHRFLLLSNGGEALPLFDSSVKAPGVEGIAPSPDRRHPDLKVALVDDVPEENMLRRVAHEHPDQHVLCYVMSGTVPLQAGCTSFIMESAFGDWLDAEFGDQSLLWGRAIAITARILEGTSPRIPLAITPKNQRELWQWLNSRPDDRHFLGKRIWNF